MSLQVGEVIGRKRGASVPRRDAERDGSTAVSGGGVVWPDVGAQEVADQWYSEIAKYDFRAGPPPEQPPTGGCFLVNYFLSSF